MMLERMRKGTAKVIGSIFAALLIVAMAAWGVEDFLRVGPTDTMLASVGEAEITAREFEREYRDAIDRLRAQLGPSFDAERARQFGIAQGTLDGMIDRRVIALQADRLGLTVGDDTIVEQIRSTEAFQGIGGNFDRAIFDQTLRNAGMSEGEYVSGLRGQLIRRFLMEAVTTGAAAPSPLAADLYRYTAQTRTAEVAIVPRSAAGKIDEPNDTQLAEFHKEHAAQFTAPEYRKISAIVLDPEKYAQQLEPAESAVRAEYQNRLPSLRVPEKRKLNQILLADEAKASDAAMRLASGETLEAVMKTAADDGSGVIDLGLMTRQDVAALSPELATAVFATEEGKTTEPVRSALGWHIVRVEEVEPGSTPSFEDVRDGIARDLARDQAIDQLVEVANQVEDAIAGGATLAGAAERVGQPLREFPPMDAQGRNRAGEPVANLPKDRNFLRVAFDAPEGEIGYMEEMENGGYFILRVESRAPPALRPLDEVRDEVAEAWKRAQRDKIASERAKELVGALNAGADLTKAATEAGYDTFTSRALTRQGDEEGKFPPALVQELFRLEPGGAAMGPAPEGFAVIRLKEINEPAMDDGGEELNQFQQNLTRALGNDIAEQFSMALRDRFTVLVDDEALESYLDSSGVR